MPKPAPDPLRRLLALLLLLPFDTFTGGKDRLPFLFGDKPLSRLDAPNLVGAGCGVSLDQAVANGIIHDRIERA